MVYIKETKTSGLVTITDSGARIHGLRMVYEHLPLRDLEYATYYDIPLVTGVLVSSGAALVSQLGELTLTKTKTLPAYIF